MRLNLTRGGFVGIVDLGIGYCRLFGALPPKFVPASSTGGVSHDPYAGATLPDIQRWFDELFDVDAKVTRVAWAALFRIHSRMVRRFRVGAVFLVGDAAHVHSPAGGQGLNLRPGTDQVVRLIRPDGHLGFAGPVAALPGYLDRVYGTPATRHVP